MTEIVASQTPPLLHGPSEKERKYDRQLRLWAASGQAALESANILVVNSGCGTVAVEALKNLILPGIGRFTIFDDAVVEEADLGVNFFLDEASLGQSRAQRCTELLLELNPEVEGDWHPKPESEVSLAQLLETASTYTMILYTHPIQAAALALLDAYGQRHKTPVVSVHSAGFYSFFRIRLPGAFPIVDTHPDETATTDLRLLAPWPELSAFADELTADMDGLGAHEHGHLPYVVILLHCLKRWRAAHDGADPTTYRDKTAFRQTVADGARRDSPEGGEENFDEAVAAVLRNVAQPSLPSGLRDVFAYRRSGLAEPATGFWLIAAAIEQFYERHQCLPLTGKVPDMKAQSKVYVRLQTLYKNKARQDAAEVLAAVRAMPGGAAVGPAEVDLFCKNAPFVKLINATPPGEDRLVAVFNAEMAKDENAKAMAKAMMAMEAGDDDDDDDDEAAPKVPVSLFPIYLALQATAHEPDASADTILERIDALVPGASKQEGVAKVAAELARTGGAELHNISALTGGMVAQEMIKIITKQYIPIDNTCVFNGIDSRSEVFRL